MRLNQQWGGYMIKLTENAKEYLKSISNDDHVTLGVKGGGCSGFTYVWDYKKNWPDVKWGKPIDDLLVLDPIAEMYVLGCTVDYVKELGGSYLKVINPNAVASCGCGESFAVQEKIMQRKLIKSEEVQWFEEISTDGERRIRVETTTSVYWKEDGATNHNPAKVTKAEYL